ncbi:MAG: sigma-70 family RNA polymerase sigma factor [Oscillospiraceae bacterium]|nr:sigma-70 family RNA polymerase sigma factor [Oscillospiraceae bacterium]
MLGVYLSVIETDDLKSRFEELYIKYSQLMYAVAFRILKNNEDAEDAVHQSFLNIARQFDKVNNISRQDIKPYLVVVVRNAAINIHRSNKRQKSVVRELSARDNTEIEFFDNYGYNELAEAIRQLPQIYRDVLFLHYAEDFSVKETAEMLNLSKGTVYKRLERGKKILADILGEVQNGK